MSLPPPGLAEEGQLDKPGDLAPGEAARATDIEEDAERFAPPPLGGMPASALFSVATTLSVCMSISLTPWMSLTKWRSIAACVFRFGGPSEFVPKRAAERWRVRERKGRRGHSE